MARVKRTAIAVPEDVFTAAEEAAHAEGRTRSGLYVVALREYLERRRSRQLRERLDAAYGDDEQTEEVQRAEANLSRLNRYLDEEDKW